MTSFKSTSSKERFKTKMCNLSHCLTSLRSALTALYLERHENIKKLSQKVKLTSQLGEGRRGVMTSRMLMEIYA